jgi:hypothetical protein
VHSDLVSFKIKRSPTGTTQLLFRKLNSILCEQVGDRLELQGKPAGLAPGGVREIALLFS